MVLQSSPPALRRAPWTLAEARRLRQLADRGLTAEEISGSLERTPGAVKAKARKSRVHIRRPTEPGNRYWLRLKLRNLRQRTDRLFADLCRARSRARAEEIRGKLNGCSEEIRGLRRFASKNRIAPGSYERLLGRIKGVLEKIRGTLMRRRAQHWRALVHLAASVLTIFLGFLEVLAKLKLVVLPILVV